MDTKFLLIELDSVTSVPRVFYKGEELTGKVMVNFNWKTQTDRAVASPAIYIKHMEEVNGRLITNTIGHNGGTE
jgi:hypothetical protein